MNPVRYFRALVLFLAWVGLSVGSVQAHHCGPTKLTVRVGQSCSWQIIADRVETTSVYIPTRNGPAGVCAISPNRTFQTRHADFTITGQSPGTNFLVVQWSYAPPQAFGVCVVEIDVVADDATPRPDRPTNEGSLCSAIDQEFIYARFLRDMLDFYVPAAAPKLLVMSQCFAGDMVASSAFAKAANIAVAAGTSPNQEGKYGGFHDDAARALKPAANRSALDVFEAGNEGKWIVGPEDATTDKGLQLFLGEWPTSGGGLALDQFSLAPVTAEGPILSRHIIVYAGRPSVKPVNLQVHPGGVTVNDVPSPRVEVSDVADRDTIKANFAGQPNTTVRTVGGEPDPNTGQSGPPGWDFPGTRDGLRRAIEEAGTAIRNSGHPAQEQFILFVGDHGMPGRAAPAPTNSHAAARSGVKLADGFEALATEDPLIDSLLREPANQPGFVLSAQPASAPRARNAQPAAPLPTFPTNQLRLRLQTAGATLLEIPAGSVTPEDLVADGKVDASIGERWTVFFPVAESWAVRRLRGVPLTVVLDNQSDVALNISDLTFTGGAISRADGTRPSPQILGVERVSATELEFDTWVTASRTYQLERSASPGAWTAIRSVTATSRNLRLRDVPPANAGVLLYRVRQLP